MSARTIEGDDASGSARDDDRVVLAARGDDSHGSLFNLTTGAVIEGPASRALTQYKATERSGAIYVTI
ncbi:MAG: hypothetical protein EB111_03615 [Actinobacteria bacterium]|nr:hypothetical protein [Actinomycetota bacterium]